MGGPDDSVSVRYRPPAPNLVYSPTWSPSGADIAFLEVQGEGEVVTLKILEVADGSVRTVVQETANSGTPSTANPFSVCWLPGGTRLVFSAAHLYVVGADGTGLRQLTTADGVFDHSVSCSQ